MTQILDQHGRPWAPTPTAMSQSFGASSRDRTRRRVGGMPPLASGRRHRDGLTLEHLTRECENAVRNQHLVRAIMAGYLTMVVGKCRPEARTEDEKWNAEAERYFNSWARACDVSGTRTLAQVAGTVALRWFDHGGCLYHRVNGTPGSAIARQGGAIELIEAVRLRNPGNRADTESLAAGVEFDETGRVVKYHVADWDERGGYLKTQTRDLDARVARLVSDPFLAGGGVAGGRVEPRLACVLELLETVDDAQRSTYLAYIIATYVAMFIRTENPDVNPADAAAQAMVEAGLASSITEAKEMGVWGPLTVMHGKPGEEPVQIKPEHPVTGFDTMQWSTLQTIAAALGVPPEIAFYRFIRNFSASRSAISVAWETVEVAQQHLIDQMLAPVWNWVISGAILSGRLNRPVGDGAGGTAHLDHEWNMPAMPVLDLNMEGQALSEAVSAGLMLPEVAVGRMGGGEFTGYVSKLKTQWDLLRGVGIEPGAKPTQTTVSKTEDVTGEGGANAVSTAAPGSGLDEGADA